MLSAYFIPLERAFVFQITKQDGRLTDWLKRNGSFTASNGWTVVSQSAPEINLLGKTIFLRGGNTEKDLRVHRCWDLSNNENRTKFMVEIDKALQEFIYHVYGLNNVNVGVNFDVTLKAGKTKNQANQYKVMARA